MRWFAAGFSLLAQAAWVITYRSVINGCCGGILQNPQPPIALPHVLRFAYFAAHPLVSVVDIPYDFPLPFGLPDRFPDAGELAGVVLFAGANAVLWFAATYALLNGMSWLCRIRIGQAGSQSARRRVHLADRDEVRSSWVAAGALLVLASVLAAGAMHRRWWLLEARRVLHASVEAARNGGDDPPGVALELSGTPDVLAPSNFVGNYARWVERRTVGTHPLDAFAAPMLWQGGIQFATGSRYEFSIQQLPDGWKVWIGVPCNGEECLGTIRR